MPSEKLQSILPPIAALVMNFHFDKLLEFLAIVSSVHNPRNIYETHFKF